MQGDAWLPAGTIPSALPEGLCSQTVLVLAREDPGVPRMLPVCLELHWPWASRAMAVLVPGGTGQGGKLSLKNEMLACSLPTSRATK